MTSEDGTYVYTSPFPELEPAFPRHVPTNTTTTITIPFSSPILDDLQMQVKELTKQNDILMEALRYCIANFSEEELKKDLRLGLIEMATKMKREG
jgi:hypothetical protein